MKYRLKICKKIQMDKDQNPIDTGQGHFLLILPWGLVGSQRNSSSLSDTTFQALSCFMRYYLFFSLQTYWTFVYISHRQNKNKRIFSQYSSFWGEPSSVSNVYCSIIYSQRVKNLHCIVYFLAIYLLCGNQWTCFTSWWHSLSQFCRLLLWLSQPWRKTNYYFVSLWNLLLFSFT